MGRFGDAATLAAAVSAAGTPKHGKDDGKAERGRHHRGGRSSPSNVPTPSRAGGNRSPGGASPTASEKTRGASSALEELMRRRGIDEAWTALEDMQARGVSTDKYTVSRMLMKTVGDGRARANPQRVYRGIALVEKFVEAQPKDVDEVLFNALLDTCCRMKDLPRLEATVKRMRELRVNPSPVTLGILVKTYGQAGDLQKVLQVWNEMEKQRGLANDVTYGCMLDACVKCGNMEKAIEIFQGMREQGKHKNTVLYTTLIKGYGLEKNLARAFEVFGEMAKEGVPYNTITYNSILDACVKCNNLAAAEALLREMTSSPTVEPDLITFSTLLKGYCHNADLDKGLQVVQAIKSRGLRCDELVYNTLMDGCVRANDMPAGIGLFEEMVLHGLKPSSHTHSILVRLYQRTGTGYEEDAATVVAKLYQHHGIDRPSGDTRRHANEARRGGGGGGHGQEAAAGGPMPKSRGNRTPAARGERGGSRGVLADSPGTPFGGCGYAATDCSSESGWSGCGHPYLPEEALQGMVPPLPGASGGDGTPFGAHSWAASSPMNSPFWTTGQGGGLEGYHQAQSPPSLGHPPPMPAFLPQSTAGFSLSGPSSQGMAVMPQGAASQQAGTNGQGDMMVFAVPMHMMGGQGSGQGVPTMTAPAPYQHQHQQHQQHQQQPQQGHGTYFQHFMSGQTTHC